MEWGCIDPPCSHTENSPFTSDQLPAIESVESASQWEGGVPVKSRQNKCREMDSTATLQGEDRYLHV